jgi:4-carboxymuconolactone decarboxylase
MAPRIPPREPPYPKRIGAMLEAWMEPIAEHDPLRIFRTFAVHEELAPRTGVIGAGILAHGLLSGPEREVVIQRTCFLCGAEYEWGVHATLFAEQDGLNETQLHSTVSGSADDDCWTPREAPFTSPTSSTRTLGSPMSSSERWASTSTTGRSSSSS